MVFASTYDESTPLAFLDYKQEMGRQTIWLVISLVLFILTLNIEWNFWNTFAYPIYGVSLFLLVMVLIIGSDIKGARSWFSLGPVSFQPSEIAKLGTCLAIASYLSFNKNDIQNTRVLLTTFALFLVPFGLIMLQSDLGSGLVFFSFFMLLYRKGLPGYLYIIGFSLIGIFIVSFMVGSFNVLVMTLLVTFALLMWYLDASLKTIGIVVGGLMATYIAYLANFEAGVWIIPTIAAGISIYLNYKKRNYKILNFVVPVLLFANVLSFSTNWAFENFLKPHQKDRINVWLRPELCDPRGSLYNLIQSKMAIGSGGFQGKGFLKGEMTKLKYVPEQSTDFIFSTIGEEQGFIGCFSVILLFTLLITRCVIIAERSRLEFFRNYAYGVAGILFVHFLINIGMTIGIMPVIGIPLPFISKGGSSLAAFTILVAIMIKMDAARNRG